jgi:hypothetical protein
VGREREEQEIAVAVMVLENVHGQVKYSPRNEPQECLTTLLGVHNLRDNHRPTHNANGHVKDRQWRLDIAGNRYAKTPQYVEG